MAAALADITTGEVRLAHGDEALLELLRSAPAEVLCEEDQPPAGVAGNPVRPRPG
jgi:hypothetical protein